MLGSDLHSCIKEIKLISSLKPFAFHHKPPHSPQNVNLCESTIPTHPSIIDENVNLCERASQLVSTFSNTLLAGQVQLVHKHLMGRGASADIFSVFFKCLYTLLNSNQYLDLNTDMISFFVSQLQKWNKI